MQLPKERDWGVTYRLKSVASTLPGKFYEVVQYIPTRPVKEVKGFYTWAALPDWVKEAITVLDTAGRGNYVKNYGGRNSDSYWLPSKSDEEATK